MRTPVLLAVSEATARRLPRDVRGAVVPVRRLEFAVPGRPLPLLPDATDAEFRRIVRRLRLGRVTRVRRFAATATRLLIRVLWRDLMLGRLLAGLFLPGRASDQVRPAAAVLLVLCPLARAPSLAGRGAAGDRGVSPP